MVELYKKDKLFGVYGSYSSAQVIANRHRNPQRSSRWAIKQGRRVYKTILPPIGKGRAKWELVQNG